MRQRRKIVALALSLLATVAVLFGSVSVAYAADDPIQVPGTNKSLHDNGDGTYTLSLSVTGSASSSQDVDPVKVIVVYDRSNSMAGSDGMTDEYDYVYTANNQWQENARYGRVGNHYYLLTRTGSQGNRQYFYTDEDGNQVQYTGTRYSRSNNTQRLSRHQVAQDAVTTLAGELLANNAETDNPNTDVDDTKIVQLALVPFGTTASTSTFSGSNWTSDEYAFDDAVYGIQITEDNDGGTNWEDAMEHAEALVDPSVKTYIIFVTDGNPTFRNNSQGQATNDGSGSSMSAAELSEAQDAALAAVQAGSADGGEGAELYGVYIYGDDTSPLARLVNYANGISSGKNDTSVSEYFKTASNKDALYDAFSAIIDKITNALNVNNVDITDEITGLTATTLVQNETDFKYYRSGGDYGTADPDNGQYGTEWTSIEADGAKKATFSEEDGVEWNLGSDFKLENGITYTVTFTVWPSQDAYDLVADLNNGTITEVPPEYASQVVQDPNTGKYAVKTNPEGGAKINYSVVDETTQTEVPKKHDGSAITFVNNTFTEEYDTDDAHVVVVYTKNSDGTYTIKKTSTPKTPAVIENPDDVMDLESTTMTVEKVWNDELTGGEDRPDEITFVIKEGDTEYKAVTLNEANGWKAEIAIAPGIKVNPGDYGSDANGVIPNAAGHEYSISEPDIDLHYELTADPVHPMLNGLTTDDETDMVDLNSDKTWTGGKAALVASNTVKGGINVKKVVTTDQGVTAPSNAKFTFTIALTDANDNPVYTTSDQFKPDGTPISGSLGYRIYKDDGDDTTPDEEVDRGTIPSNGQVTLTMTADQYIRIVNVPAGTKYTVTEGNLPDGFVQVSVDGGNGTVQGNGSSNVTVTNKYEATKASVEKVWNDADYQGKPGYERPASIEVTLTGKAGNDTVSTDTQTLSESNSWKYTWENLPKASAGTDIVYTVTENVPSSYTATPVTADGKTTITNTPVGKKDVIDPVTLNIVKTDRNTGHALAGAQFTVKNSAGEVVANVTTDKDGKASIKFEKADDYKMTETAPTGYTSDPGMWTIDVDQSDVQNIQYDDPNKGVWNWFYHLFFGSGTDYENGTLNVSNPPATTDVEATKVWNDSDDQDGKRPENVTFQLFKTVGDTTTAVKDANGNNVTATLSGEGNSWTATFEGLPAYEDGNQVTYTVDEAPVDGYAKSISDISGSATAGYSYTITNSNVTVDTNTTAFFKKSVTTPNDVQDAVFEFKIEALDGAPMPKDSTGAVVTTGTATYEKGKSGDKAINFGKITYTAAGEYKYKITETNRPAGWNASSESVEVTVTVTGDAATGFKATVDGKTITNSYSAKSVKRTLNATKNVYGKDAEGAFEFSLKLKDGDKSGVIIPEGSATAATSDSIKKGGSEQVSFADIEFTKPGTYVFTVDETTEAPSDKWVYDASTHDITVKVTDDGAGALSAKVTGDNPAFYNTYEDDVKTVSAGTSTTNIDGQDVQAGQTLTYTINWTAAAGGETADVVVTDTIPANTTLKADSVSAGGTVSEDGKTITWAFPRQEPGATGTVSFQVTVDEAAAGTKLDNAATVLSGKNDANTNTVTNEVKKGGFKLSKVIVSTTGVTDDEAEFTFEVSAKDSAGNPLKGSYAVKVGDETAEKAFEDGKIEITLTNGQVAVIDGLPVGTTYTVTETDVPKGYELTAVNGEDAPAEGTISGVVDVDVLSFEFENTYSASGKAEIPVSKTVTSATEGTEPGKWSFDFAIAAGAYEGEAKDVAVPLPEETTVTLSGSGNETVSGAFGEIEYAAAGTYTYTVTESGTEGSANAGISPVEATKTVTVTVEDNGDGSLTATVKDAGTAAAFENVYNVEKTGIVLGASKKLEVEKPANNAPDVSGKYTFTLKEDDEVIDTKTNPDGDGTAVSFEKISYDKPGEHQYTVTESGKVEGVTNGQDSYTVKVNVSDQGDGTLKAEVTEGSQVTAFTNTYSVEPVTLDTTKQFNVTKSLDGTPLTAGAFKFTLTAGSNDADVETPMPKNASVTNDASGKVTFGEITYNKPGTYNYTISEVDGGVGGYTYDKNTVAVKVVVTDNGAGALVAEVSYDGSTTFVNTYEAKGEFAPTAQKLVEGHSLADEQFTFQLLDKDGKVIEETKNNDAGQVIFKAIQYTQDDFDDMATTEEDATDEAATTTDEAADTTDEAAATTDEAAATTDEAADTTDEAADTTDEATTDEAAADEATTDEAKPQKRTKTFEYTVREINDGQGGWTYDDHEAKYIVTVTDNGEGEMEISYEKDGEPTFVNTYKATGKTGEGALAGTKTVPGTKLKDGQFSFQLKDSDGNVIETVSNDANGNFEFSALSYVKNSKKDETGEHTYSIVEVNDGQRGYTYDSHVCDVTVTVTDNDEGKLNVTVKLSDGKKAAFSNPYKPLATSAPVTAKKVLEGRDLKAGEFTFELRDAEGKVVATATNAASGLVDFGYVSFDEVGTYTFTATEVKGSDANVTYDSSTKTYTVEVVDDGGQLVATVTCDDPSATFTNVYKKPDVPGKPGKPKKKVVIPQTGDDTPTGAMAALTVFGAAALTAGTVLQRRKRK